MSARIKIFDTTLRDGERLGSQPEHTGAWDCPSACKAWRGRHRAGFAISSPGFHGSEDSCGNERAGIASFSGAVEKDIDRAWEALQNAENSAYTHS